MMKKKLKLKNFIKWILLILIIIITIIIVSINNNNKNTKETLKSTPVDSKFYMQRHSNNVNDDPIDTHMNQ